MHRLKGNDYNPEAGREVKMETHSGRGASQTVLVRGLGTGEISQ